MDPQLPDPQAVERAALLDRDYVADRCTIQTQSNGAEWRTVAMGPRMIKGKVQLVTIAKEYKTSSEMVEDVPVLIKAFYEMD